MLSTAFFVLLLNLSALAQSQPAIIDNIEFFGTTGIDVQKLRASLRLKEGDQLTFDSIPDLKSRVAQNIKDLTAAEVTDVAPVCCSQRGQWLVYIGLQGKNFKRFTYDDPPHGSARLPLDIVNTYRQTMDLLLDSIQNHATEDRSRGYALSSYEPLRSKQLAMREYAEQNAQLIRRVLAESSDPEHRVVAAQLLGYTNQDQSQLDSLVKASHDSDENVRNNAVRALGVLAQSKHAIAARISANADNFVGMLNSGTWTDRNKGAYLINMLTTTRDTRLLGILRSQAADSLVEMTRWKNPGHAESARFILGRLAGIDEKQLTQLVATQQSDVIIREFEKSRH